MADTIEEFEMCGFILEAAINLVAKVEQNLKNFYDQQYYEKLPSVLKKNCKGNKLILSDKTQG